MWRRASSVLWLVALLAPTVIGFQPPTRRMVLVVGIVSEPVCSRERTLVTAIDNEIGSCGLSGYMRVGSMHLDKPDERERLCQMGFHGADDVACGIVELDTQDRPIILLQRFDSVGESLSEAHDLVEHARQAWEL